MPWKWWAKYQKFDEQNAKVEVVDLFHFLVSLAQTLGMTADESRAIVLSWIDAVNRGDGEAVAGGFAAGATWWVSGSLPVSGLYEGRDAIMRDFFAPALDLFQPGTFRLEPKSVIAEGARVAVEWEGFAISAKGCDRSEEHTSELQSH